MRALFGPLATPRPWKQTLHLLLDLPLGIAWFTWVVTMLSVGGGLAVTVIGIPLLALTVVSGRWIGTVERGRSRLFLDDDPPTPAPMHTASGWLALTKAGLGDGPGWKGLAYGVLMLPWGIITFTVAVTIWSTALGLVTTPTYAWALPDDGLQFGSYELTGPGKWGAYAGCLVLGLALLAVTPRVIAAMAEGDRRLVRLLLSPDPTKVLTERVEQLQESRAASVEGAASELRRIERDLHDGAQQRLVGLAMDLGIARDRLEASDDPKAAELVGRAHDEAKLAIAEVRDLVRGIHPAVLTDRGLDAAVSALAARCPVPVELVSDLRRRLPAPVEAAAYFVVAEALTNVAKHSEARRARVSLHDAGDRVVVDVYDDGRGGAQLTHGSGLQGLHDRVRALDGRLAIASPVGGPTTIVVELPCGS
ncbi:MAG: sensor domain-containing protein [Ilumatobacteraceae bacterium]